MATDLQALSDELAKMNQRSSMWAQPQIQQSGAAAMLQQNQAQLQPYMLQNYSYANPGAMAPSTMFANPMGANYQLQQQYYMNPYQSRFYGGQFNDQLPGAEYSTSSRMGIYRQGQQNAVAGGYAQPGFISDVTTLTGFRSYAGYQNPHIEQMQASQRMTERVEAATVAGIELAGLAGSLLATGPIGITAATVGAPLLSAGASSYFGRRRQTGQIGNVMRDLVSGQAATGVLGTGISARESSAMMRQMNLQAAYDPTKSSEDYMNILQTGAATGLFNFEDTSSEIMGKMKKAAGMMNMMMMLAEDPDIQSTVKRMSDFQAMGVSLGQMERMATDVKAFARLSNASFEEVMSRGGAIGAQQMQLMGGSAAFGIRAGVMGMGAANRMMQSGFFNAEEAALRGGRSGITQATTGMMTNDVHSYLSTRAALFMNPDGSVNQDMLNKVISGKAGDTISGTLDKFAGIDKATYLMNFEDAVATAQSQLSPRQAIALMKRQMDDTMAMGNITTSEYYASRGKEGKILKYLFSKDYENDMIISEARVMEEKASKRYAEAEQASKWYNRAGRSIAVGYEEAVNKYVGPIFDNVAERQERGAAAAAGAVYRPGMIDTTGLSKAAKARFSDSVSMDTPADYSSIMNRTLLDRLNPFENESNEIMNDISGLYGGKKSDIIGGFKAFEQASKAARGMSPMGDLSINERLSFDKALETLAPERAGLLAGSEFNIKEFNRVASKMAKETGMDPGEFKAKLIQYVGKYGTDEQKRKMRRVELATKQEKQNTFQQQIDQYREVGEKAFNIFGKEDVTAYSNLRGMGLSFDQINKLSMGSELSPQDLKSLERLGLSEDQLGEVQKYIEDFRGEGTGKEFMAEMRKAGKDAEKLLEGGAAYLGASANARDQRKALTRQFGYSSDFNVFATAEENARLSGLAKEIEENVKGEENKKIAKADLKKDLENATISNLSQGPGATKEGIKSAMHLERIEMLIRKAIDDDKNWIFGGN